MDRCKPDSYIYAWIQERQCINLSDVLDAKEVRDFLGQWHRISHATGCQESTIKTLNKNFENKCFQIEGKGHSINIC